METKLKSLNDFNPKNIAEILWMADDIIKIVKDDPIKDKVFMIPLYDKDLKEDNDSKEKVKYCIAGSTAVVLFSKLLRLEQLRLEKSSNVIANYKIGGNFINNDTDIFFLESKTQHRKQCGNVDIVHLKESTVESLLLNFDLGCCRAAIDDDVDSEVGWISAHCIVSLLTGEYFLPSYLAFQEYFLKTFSGSFHQLIYENNTLTETSLVDKLFQRLKFRREKYGDRGYICVFYKTDEKLSWITHRFFYGELLMKV